MYTPHSFLEPDLGLLERWTIAADETGYMDGLLSGIAAFTIDVRRIEATWRLNQNHSSERRRWIIAALRESGRPTETEVADLMQGSCEALGTT